MTQVERDRLVALRKAEKKIITQKQAAEELGLSTRQVKRLVRALKKRGDEAVVHRLREIQPPGRPAWKQLEPEL